jgi:hypothetical protein
MGTACAIVGVPILIALGAVLWWWLLSWPPPRLIAMLRSAVSLIVSVRSKEDTRIEPTHDSPRPRVLGCRKKEETMNRSTSIILIAGMLVFQSRP